MNNLVKRVLAGIIGIPLILAVSYFGGVYFLVFAILVSTLALWEFCIMFETKGYSPLKFLGLTISMVLIIISYFDWNYFELSVFIIVPLISISEILRKTKNPMNTVVLLFGILYITFPFILLINLSDSSNTNIVIYIFILIWVCDSAAYFGGRLFGKNRLSSVSPNKTREGSITGFIFTLMISLLIHFIFPDKISLTDSLIMGLIIGIFSQAGDLFESLIKRYCEVKDSSGIIPGHGGVLDRFDSLIFAAPLVFIYFMYVK